MRLAESILLWLNVHSAGTQDPPRRLQGLHAKLYVCYHPGLHTRDVSRCAYIQNSLRSPMLKRDFGSMWQFATRFAVANFDKGIDPGAHTPDFKPSSYLVQTRFQVIGSGRLPFLHRPGICIHVCVFLCACCCLNSPRAKAPQSLPA